MILTIAPSNFSTFQKGLGRLKPRSLRGLGNTAQLQQAQSLLQQSGYTGVECREEQVYFPGTDPNTGKNYYTQQICTAPGFTGGFTVENVLNSTLATPGRGVNLAAERANLIASGNDGPGRSNYAFEGAFNTITTNAIDAFGNPRQITALPAPTSAEYLRAFDSDAATRAQTPAPPTPATKVASKDAVTETDRDLTPPASSDADFDLSKLFDNPMVLYAALGLGGLLIFSSLGGSK